MKARAFPLAVACLLAITSRTAGQDVDWEAESLRGLDGLRVIVEDLPDHATKVGFTRDALETYLEMRLRQARIPLLSKAEWASSERGPLLHLSVAVIPTARGWAYMLMLEVMQSACIEGGMEGQEGPLALEGGCSFLTTWGDSWLYTTANLSDSVRGNLAELMDQLVNDYLTVNP